MVSAIVNCKTSTNLIANLDLAEALHKAIEATWTTDTSSSPRTKVVAVPVVHKAIAVPVDTTPASRSSKRCQEAAAREAVEAAKSVLGAAQKLIRPSGQSASRRRRKRIIQLSSLAAPSPFARGSDEETESTGDTAIQSERRSVGDDDNPPFSEDELVEWFQTAQAQSAVAEIQSEESSDAEMQSIENIDLTEESMPLFHEALGMDIFGASKSDDLTQAAKDAVATAELALAAVHMNMPRSKFLRTM